MPGQRRHLFAALLATTLVGASAATVASAPAGPRWADAASATIRPGVQTVSDGAGCTSNFVFTDTAGRVYLGQAAHCTGTGSQTDTNGCNTGSLALGLPVEVKGAKHPGTLAYSSWLTMQAVGETNPDACSYNDFALIALHPDDVAFVNPSVKSIGGPVALTDTVASGSRVHSYGNSSLRFGLSPLSPKSGISIGQRGGGWTHTVYTVSPGIPGDSGSGFLDDSGRAFGVLSTLALAPYALSNGVSDLSRALAYAAQHAGLRVQLALGTEAFTGGILPTLGTSPTVGLLSGSR